MSENLDSSYFFEDFPLIRDFNVEDLITLLHEVGDMDDAEKLRNEMSDLQNFSGSKSFSSVLSSSSINRIYFSNNYTIGYLPPKSGQNRGTVEIKNAVDIDPDDTLRGEAISITLDRLKIKKYPGRHPYTILFNFYTENNIENNIIEKVHFSQVYKVYEDGVASVYGRPIFRNLNISENGLFFKFLTINIKDNQDKTFLRFLESGVVNLGLNFLKMAQPVIGITSQIVVGITRGILKRSKKNHKVQQLDLGMGFTDIYSRYKLRRGSYIIVQILEGQTWDWSKWVFNTSIGDIIRKQDDEDGDQAIQIPFNYFILGVS
ncbi:MAG: hypothetical protein ACTSRH_08120 [Promethearchaeota archaeon]